MENLTRATKKDNHLPKPRQDSPATVADLVTLLSEVTPSPLPPTPTPVLSLHMASARPQTWPPLKQACTAPTLLEVFSDIYVPSAVLQHDST